MPKGNGTGPNGNGPKTGRGLGKCNGNKEGGFLNNENYRSRKNSTKNDNFRNKTGFGRRTERNRFNSNN